MNPYLGFIIAAGLEGIEKGLVLPSASNVDLNAAEENITKNLTPLPADMHEAIRLAETSGFVKSVLGEELLLKYISFKKTEAEEFTAAEDKMEFYRKRYFEFI